MARCQDVGSSTRCMKTRLPRGSRVRLRSRWCPLPATACLTGDEGRSRSSPCVRDFGVLPCSRACDHRARRRPAGSPPPTSRRLPSCRSCVCAAIRAGPWRCSSQWSCCLTPRQYPSRRQASSAVQGCGDPRRVTERTQPTPALWSDLDARTSDFF